jgi:hypothetical protein
VRPDPHRGIRLLVGARLRADLIEAPVLPVIRELALGPRLEDDFHRLAHGLAAVFEVHVPGLELFAARSRTDAEFEPAAGEVVDHRGVLREANRMVQGQLEDHHADADLRGRACQRGQVHRRCRDARKARVLVLDEEEVAVAELLGHLRVGDVLFVALGGQQRIVGVDDRGCVEEAELEITHGRSTPRGAGCASPCAGRLWPGRSRRW